VMQQFGFSSVPPSGSDAVLACIAGDRSNSAVIATGNSPSRPMNKVAGESVVFNAFGITIYLSQNGIMINGGGKPISITNCPTLTQNGDIHATGAVIAGFGGADQVGLQTHKHGEGTAAAGTTAPTPST
jgi:phage gp45-like